MQDQLNRIEAKLDRLDERQDKASVELGRYNVILDEHVKRSTMLEDRLAPIEKDHTRLLFLIKIIGVLVGSLGVIGTVIDLVAHFGR